MTILCQERPDDGFDLVLDEALVSYVTLTVQLEIRIVDATRDTLMITISTPFCINDTDGTSHDPIDPETNDPRIGEVILRLRFNRLATGNIDPDGTLRLVFDDGFAITVRPDPKYEAWDLEHSGFKIVARAGGELAIWDR